MSSLPFKATGKPRLWSIDPSLVDQKWGSFHKNLRGAFGVFGEDVRTHYGALYRDYSQFRKHGSAQGPAPLTVKMLKDGRAISFASAAQNHRIDLGSIPFGHPLNFGGEKSMSWMVKCRYGGSPNSSFPRIFDKSDGGGPVNGYALNYNLSIPGFQWIVADTVEAKISNWQYDVTISAGQTFTLGFSSRGDLTDGQMYFDGLPVTSTLSGTITPIFPEETTNMAIGNWNHAGDRMWDGEIELVYILSGDNPDGFFKDLHDDPYGPFYRAPARVPMVPVAPTGRIMSSLVAGGGLAGYGGIAGPHGGLAG